MSARRLNRSSKFMLVLSAVLVLLPVYGPWINFHFAESQPDHTHIYLGKVDLNHHRSGTKDVVNLPDQDATSQGMVLVFLPEVGMIKNTAEFGHLSFKLSDEYLAQEDTFLPPPDHPPRT